MRRVASLACALSLAAAPHAGAQAPATAAALHPDEVSSVFQVRAAAPLPTGATTSLLANLNADAAPAPVVKAPAARRGMEVHSLVHTVAGAALGAWLGLFTSQVVKSDWDKNSDSEVISHRRTFALGGALVGGAGGLLLAKRLTAPLVVSTREPRNEGEVITQDQVDETGLTSAFEVVRLLKPQWLRTRGYNSFSEGGRIFAEEGDRTSVTVVPGIEALVVYLDNTRLGGLETLRELQSFNVGSIRFLTPAEASFRWGINHTHGVIWVSSRSSD